MRRQIRRLFTFGCTFLVVAAMLITPTGYSEARAAPAAPNDTPTPVVNEPVTDWTLNDGLLYWAYPCIPGPDLQAAAVTADFYLRRKPANGGVTRTLAEYDGNPCVPAYNNLTANTTGLYYYDFAGGGIFFRPSASPFDPPTPVLATGQNPLGGSKLVLVGDTIYWLSANGKILRVKRDGTGLEEFIVGITGPRDLVLAGGSAYWLDDGGLWQANLGCTPLPCSTKTGPVVTNGYYLSHILAGRGAGVFNITLYWVDYGSPQRILRRSCSLLIGCSAVNTYYNAPSSDWYLGKPVSDGANLFWTEQFLGSGPSDGKVRRRALNAALDDPADEIVTNFPSILQQLEKDTQYLYFQKLALPDPGIYRIPLNAAAIVRDLAADNLEVTQGIQSLANDVPLAAKKTTYVRAYGREESGPNAVGVDAYLYGTRGGSPLPGSPRSSLNGTQALAVGGSYDRADVEDGWLFQLPSSWISAGNIELRLEVDPRQAYPDPSRANNSLTHAVNFAAKGPVCTIFIPVRTSAPLPSTSTPNFWPMIDYAKRLFPTFDYWAYHQNSAMEELQVCWAGPFPYPCFGPYELPDDTWKVFITMGVRDAFTDDPDECQDANGSIHYVGMVHPSTNTNTDDGTVNGTGMTAVFDYSWVKFPTDAPISPSQPFAPSAGDTLAHELGHNLDRDHVDCGSPDNVDNGYPYPTNQIGDVGNANHYGFDVKTRTAIRPNGAKDVMGYCSPKWTSDYTWKALFNSLSLTSAAGVSAAATGAATDLSGAANAILVTGAVTPTQNSGFLGYAYNFPTAALSQGQLRKWQARTTGAINAAAAGRDLFIAANYHIRLLDAANQVLADQPITPVAPHVHEGPSPVLYFIATFPAPTATVARLELLQNDTVIASRAPGVSVPAVTILKPAGGEIIDDQLELSWQASDANPGDILLYAVQYSPDNGATWLALLTDMIGPRDSNTVNLTLNNLSIPGSLPNGARIRVAASDGYNTGLATSAPFTVNNRKPDPFIMAPAAGESTPAGQPVLLRGDANDAEDGGLSDDSLQWTVNNQAVGTGEELNVNGLAPGDHSMALTARDALSQTASAQATLKILPLGIPQDGTPTLDGFCADAPYASGVEIGLAPYGDGAAASVRLMRSATQLWACFNGLKLGAAAPGAFAGLRVDVDNSRNELAQATDYGFFVGEDGGVATLAGDGAGGFAGAGPGGLAAQISATPGGWSAELRIDASVLGGWEHLVGLKLGHYWVGLQGDDYGWPYAAVWNQPKTWALTALGQQPQLITLTPAAATAGATDFQMVISGTNFLTSTVVLWDGAPIPAAFGSSSLLTATVSAVNIATAAVLPVLVRNPGNLDSNPLPFVVSNPAPALTSLTPSAMEAESAGFTLLVKGVNFVNGATVLWNGTALPTTFVSGVQLSVLVDAALLAQGAEVNVTVLNPAPEAQASNMVTFTVEPKLVASSHSIFLPLIRK